MYSTIKLPDIINCTPKNNFSIINRDTFRTKGLSFKAKGILGLLLTNSEGWTTHVRTMCEMGPDGRESIQNGLKELEEFGYLWRISYVDSKTKSVLGSTWAYTDNPYVFNSDDLMEWLDSKGYEIWSGSKKPQPEKPNTGNPFTANPPLNSIKEKKEEFKEETLCPPAKINRRSRTPIKVEPKVDTDLPFKNIANALHRIIAKHHPNNVVTPKQVEAWVTPIKKIFKFWKGTPETLLSWLRVYYNHFDRKNKYHIVLMSGEGLLERMKEGKLESFVDRACEENKEVQPTLPNVDKPKKKFKMYEDNTDVYEPVNRNEM